MDKNNFATYELIQLIGSPFFSNKSQVASEELLLNIFKDAFRDRVAPLYLSMYRRDDWDERLEELFQTVKRRERLTQLVISDLANLLNKWNPDGYVIFKSIKPYPAIPNDTDVLIFGRKKEFDSALNFLYSHGYIFHEWAPLQTTLYDQRGKGKIGAGKKGGIYYIDVYREISTDYVAYLNKQSLKQYVYVDTINNSQVRLLKPEPELAILLFHNLFPERTFQLEHFFMPLYYLANLRFDINKFISFIENNHLTFAVMTNLTLIEVLHQMNFNSVPRSINELLQLWGRNEKEKIRFEIAGCKTPYMFSSQAFFKTLLSKLNDSKFRTSLISQAIHMLNPIFFVDVMKSLSARLSSEGIYHME